MNKKTITAKHLAQGSNAEQLALKQLHKQGLKLLCQNYRCPQGEIDLIMQDKDTLVFIEVRYRKNSLYGGAEASITRSKQNKIRQTAMWFLQQYPQHQESPCRFDVVALHQGDEQGRWIQNAFE